MLVAHHDCMRRLVCIMATQGAGVPCGGRPFPLHRVHGLARRYVLHPGLLGLLHRLLPAPRADLVLPHPGQGREPV
jgi:hypothetical protein